MIYKLLIYHEKGQFVMCLSPIINIGSGRLMIRLRTQRVGPVLHLFDQERRREFGSHMRKEGKYMMLTEEYDTFSQWMLKCGATVYNQ